jgi:Tol biopolymer transport system component
MGSAAEFRQSLPSALPKRAVQDQLHRILASATFARSERLSSFLRFTVEEKLAGRGDSLKEQVLAAALYARQPGSANDDDSVVRADARRVRDKLREFYAESRDEPVVISLPKGSYTPAFEWNASGIALAEPLPRRASKNTWIRAAGVVAAIGLATALGWWTIQRPASRPQVRPLTTYPGTEQEPSLSPDGNFVAFSWSGSEQAGPTDIWIRSVGGEALRRLTETPDVEVTPAWSPDGKEIAFTRQKQGVFVISHLGAPERRVSETGRNPRWTPDGRSLLILDHRDSGVPAAIFQIDLERLTRRQLTHPASGNGDWHFEVSPDGGTLAFTRSDRSGVGDIYTMPMSGGAPRRLTDWGAPIYGLAWTPDGREIVYAVAGQSLWRISARTASPEKGTQLAGFEGMVTPMALPFHPTISRPVRGQPARLVFETRSRHISLQGIELGPAGGPLLNAKPLLRGTRVDVPGAISPDGQKLLFRSYSPAGWRLWVVKRDGRDLRQLPAVAAFMTDMGSWSPDGRHIVFDAAVDGNSDIYVVAQQGGLPRRLTTGPSIEIRASWSRDGRWIYYSSNRTGRYEVWKIPAAGGAPIQVTRNGGFEPTESVDGRSIYYLDRPPKEGVIWIGEAKLRNVPVQGGEETTVLPVIRNQSWGVTNRGILFLSLLPEFDAIDLFSLSERRVSRVGQLPFRIGRRGFARLAFSRDGDWAVTNREDRVESDLMLVDNFR